MEEINELFEKLYKSETKIYKVSAGTLSKYIDYWTRHILEDKRELLYTFDADAWKYIAVDNTTGNCWVEEFNNEIDALKWLGGAIE